MNGRLHVDRIELDLRGVPAATAEAAVRGLGPALGEALRTGGDDSAGISAAGNASSADLRRCIAQQLAAAIRREAARSAELF